MKISCKKYLVLCLFLVAAIQTLFAQQQEPYFKNGDKVCFIGNSITHGGSYHAFVQLYCVTRFPNAKVEFYNCGISGDVADGMIDRFEDDIMIHQPDFAFIMTGMNDVQRLLYFEGEHDEENIKQRQKALDNYYNKTERLANMLIENKVQPIFMTPSIYDQTAKIERFNDYGTNDALATCAVHIRKMAKKYKAPLIDLHAAMEAINQKGQLTDSTFTIVGPDRVHPGDLGHFIMAYEIIKTLMPSEYVSQLEINARKKRVELAENCTVKIQQQSNELEFEIFENALPFPVKEDLLEVLTLIPFQQDLNNETLNVKKLKKGNYQLIIDEIKVGEYSSKQLKEGVNLVGNRNTPQYKQAEQIAELFFDYKKIQSDLRTIAHIEYKMLADYSGPSTLAEKKKFLDAKVESQKGKSWYNYMKNQCNEYFLILPKEESLWKELNEIRTKIYTLNKPVVHIFKLIKI